MESLMQAHLRAKRQFLRSEEELRRDYDFRKSLSAKEQKACEIVRQIRARELTQDWAPRVDEHEHHIFPGVAFDLAKETIEQTQTWKIVKRLPKGALLHAHFDGMVDMPWLIHVAVTTPGMHVKSNLPLTSLSELSKAALEFEYAPHPSVVPPAELFSDSYQPGTLVSLRQAASQYPFGGPQAFEEHITSKVMFSTSDCKAHHEGINQIWSRFESIFNTLGGITFYEPIFRQFIQRMFAQALSDEIYWIDLRVVFLSPFKLSDGKPGQYRDVLHIFQEEMDKFKRSDAGSSFWGARIVWTCHRRQDDSFILRDMKDCLAAKEEFPTLIAGYDLVGQEGLGRTLEEHLQSLLWFRSECERRDLDIPFIFHAGEVPGDGDPHDLNLFDAILLGTKRIGHGYSLYKHPIAMERVKTEDICIEVCPVSNELLRLNASTSCHPVPALLANGIATALSSDTPGVFGHIGIRVSCDFWQVLNNFDSVGLEGLGSIAETSVSYASFCDKVGRWEERHGGPDTSREHHAAIWRQKWLKFCDWIISEFDQPHSPIKAH